jgi:hypothetical protein
MTTAPQDGIEPVTWRFVVLPWWGVIALAAGTILLPKAIAHAKAFTHHTYASMPSFRWSPLAFTKRTSQKVLVVDVVRRLRSRERLGRII